MKKKVKFLIRKSYGLWLPILSLFLFILICELICQGFDLTEKMDADFKFYIRSIDNDIEEVYNVEDPLLMWSPKPNYIGAIVDSNGNIFNDGLKINSVGFRDKEYNLKKDENVFRILTLGDSNTFGWNSNLQDIYAKVLEKKLNEKSKVQEIK